MLWKKLVVYIYIYMEGYFTKWLDSFSLPSVPMQPAQQPQQPLRPRIRDEDVTQLREMFPSLDEEVVRSVLEASNGRVDSAVTNLLQMTQ